MIVNPSFWLLLVLLTGLVRWLPPRRRAVALAFASWAYLVWLTPLHGLAYSALCLAAWRVPARVRSVEGGAWHGTAVVVVALLWLCFWKVVARADTSSLPFGLATSGTIPLGVSYFTFKLIHFTIESRRGTLRERSPASFVAYMFLFPIFSAGPIERYDHFVRSVGPQPGDLLTGSTRVLWGLVKRFVGVETVLAALLATYGGAASMAEHGLDRMAPSRLWFVLAVRFLSGYLDFSAYSDIAIGAGRMLGVNIAENLNSPLAARSITDFWKRWHITLASFCQTYVYMPTIALSRRPILAMYAAFICIGIWHGATVQWLCWGL